MPSFICLKQAANGACFPKWELVYYYFSKWKYTGAIEQVREFLRDLTRKKAGRNVSPSSDCIDSLSVKTARMGGQDRGFDGGRNIKGRKRHIVTDSMGFLLTVAGHAANVHDSKGAYRVVASLKGRFGRLVKIVADGGYRGELIERTKAAFGFILEIVPRPNQSPKNSKSYHNGGW